MAGVRTHGGRPWIPRSLPACLAALVALASLEVRAGSLEVPRIASDGRVAVIPLDPDNVASVKELIQGPLLSSRGLNATLFAPVGRRPEVVLSGEADNVRSAVEMIKEMFLETGAKHPIGRKASIITGGARTGSYTAPVYSDKRFQTNRIFPADGRTYVVGAFVSDSLIKSRSGVPLLSEIPLVKYLFSRLPLPRLEPNDLQPVPLLADQRLSPPPESAT